MKPLVAKALFDINLNISASDQWPVGQRRLRGSASRGSILIGNLVARDAEDPGAKGRLVSVERTDRSKDAEKYLVDDIIGVADSTSPYKAGDPRVPRVEERVKRPTIARLRGGKGLRKRTRHPVTKQIMGHDTYAIGKKCQRGTARAKQRLSCPPEALSSVLKGERSPFQHLAGWTIMATPTNGETRRMSSIEILIDGHTSVLQTHQTAVIGRGDSADLKLDDPRVSRVHATVSYANGSWVLEDSSSGGTWQNGQRVTRLPVNSEVRVRMGSEGAPEIILRPAGIDPNATVAVGSFTQRPAAPAAAARPSPIAPQSPPISPPAPTPEPIQPPFVPAATAPPRRTGLIVAAAVVGLVAVLGIGSLLARDSGEGVETADPAPTTVVDAAPLSAAERLSQAKLATVQLLVVTENGLSTGSGAFVSDDLILTNRHVIGGATDIEIATSSAEDTPVELRYSGRVEAEHPYLDLALVRVVGVSALTDLTLGELGSPTVLPIGDSSTVRVGDTIQALGFPSIAGQLSVDDMGELALPVTTVSRGEVVTFRLWPGCTNPAADSLLVPGGFGLCVPDGDLPRGNMITDDLSGSGGSGGPVVVDGSIVAVRYAVGGADDPIVSGAISTGGVALSMPSEYFADWVAEVVAG